MRIITSVGYYGTGSSAVTDYLKEFSNISLAGKGSYEIRFVQDPDGISDLAYHVVEDNHRHNTSHAIKRFIKYLKFLNGGLFTKRYRKFFGEQFLSLSMNYVNSIVELESKTWWHYDQIEKGKFFYTMDIAYGKLSRMFRTEGGKSLLKGREKAYYTSIDKDEFYTITKQYLDTLFEQANVRKTPNIIVEQLVPPSNAGRYLQFFNDLKIIVVERDPRDVYISSRDVYDEGIIPAETVEEFCKWYKITRKHRDYEPKNDNVLFIQFEDFVYHYRKTAKKINEFLGLDEKDHIEKRKYFDPNRSIKGTRQYLNNQKYVQDVAYIEKELERYLYTDYDMEADI